jgi:hypothetical protein
MRHQCHQSPRRKTTLNLEGHLTIDLDKKWSMRRSLLFLSAQGSSSLHQNPIVLSHPAAALQFLIARAGSG